MASSLRTSKHTLVRSLNFIIHIGVTKNSINACEHFHEKSQRIMCERVNEHLDSILDETNLLNLFLTSENDRRL